MLLQLRSAENCVQVAMRASQNGAEPISKSVGSFRKNDHHMDLPKCLLDAANVVAFPIPLHDLLLTNGNPCPRHPHVRNAINIILIEHDLLIAYMTFWPLFQSPLLNNLLRRVQSHELTRNIAIKDSELSTRLCALKLSWWSSCECS